MRNVRPIEIIELFIIGTILMTSILFIIETIC